MNNQQAKFILLAYRVNGADANDPQFKAALAQAQRDPDLAKWFAEQRLLDISLRNKLKAAVTPPRELRSQVLALHQLVRHVPWWKQPAWIAAAASVALLLSASAAWYFRSPPPPVWDFLSAMAQASVQTNRHITIAGHTQSEIRQSLRNRHADAGFELPSTLANQPIAGASIVSWKGQSVVMICLSANQTNHVDLFVAQRAGFPEGVPPMTPQCQDSCSMSAAAWSTANRIYLLAGPVPEATLRTLVGAEKAPGQ